MDGETTERPAVRPQISGETMTVLKSGAARCADCASILKSLVTGDRLSPGWHADGTPFPVEAQKRHILEMKWLAFSPENVKYLRSRAGTARKENGTGCFYCARILDAMTKDGQLREWPLDSKYENLKLSVEAQSGHVMLEFGIPVEWEIVKA